MACAPPSHSLSLLLCTLLFNNLPWLARIPCKQTHCLQPSHQLQEPEGFCPCGRASSSPVRGIKGSAATRTAAWNPQCAGTWLVRLLRSSMSQEKGSVSSSGLSCRTALGRRRFSSMSCDSDASGRLTPSVALTCVQYRSAHRCLEVMPLENKLATSQRHSNTSRQSLPASVSPSGL